MPPTRTSVNLSIATRPKRTAARRASLLLENQMAGKRKAESPLKKPTTKRSAFGDITNAIGKSANDTKKVLKNVTNAPTKALTAKLKDKKAVEKEPVGKKVAPSIPTKKTTTATISTSRISLLERQTKAVTTTVNLTKPSTRSRGSLKRTESLDVTNVKEKLTVTVPAPKEKAVAPAPFPILKLVDAFQTSTIADATTDKGKSSVTSIPQKEKKDVPASAPVPSIIPLPMEPVRSSARLSGRLSLNNDSGENSIPDDLSPQVSEAKDVPASPEKKLPPGVEDFDAESSSDPFAVSEYAMDIFEYLKSRESLYKIGDYMESQIELSKFMRSLLVDWMVEVQENFELNHETLYLGVKIVDIYLSKVRVSKMSLQLVGAAAMFIASKFDERVPPLVDDLTYVCDGAYTHEELIGMEVDILRVIDFDLAMPLSYRFLRRYARCAKIAMPQLTLARYILELSLMEYSMITVSDSKLAAAALLLSIRMQDLGSWTPTLQYYSGYKLDDIRDLCHQLNDMLHKKPKAALQTVRNKYSHKVFYEVATIPLVDNSRL